MLSRLSATKILTPRETALDPRDNAQVSTRLSSTATSFVPIYSGQDAAKLQRARRNLAATESTLLERRRARHHALQENRLESARATRVRLRRTGIDAFGDCAARRRCARRR